MAAEFSDVVTQLLKQELAKYLNVAALSVFDYCLTLSLEVHHVWGRKWEITRIVFTISRYLPFIASAMTFYNILYSHKVRVFSTVAQHGPT
ncbi:hypothetical protein PAXRUDRAFT_432579 [Paxillus rubicundulus Ve08.2h10]|uniref:DUF6533 domain-containing protein n=1 Tax=Paxillus rubicundulus Ve08.2h10 TaxID=930991 RepID=A0A0D0CYS3_9AGAM|nr:hypothetical protein PAXRUDRAFT_432579 [Paxillus rubicundulus Ve08.2h10]